MALDLDRWLPEPQVRTLHRRAARTEPDRLWREAERVTVADLATLGRILRWRIPGISPESSIREVFGRYPFAVLAEGDRWSVSGLCGPVWTLQRDYPRISGPEEFLGWDEPDTVRVLFAHWVEADGDGTAWLVSESRVQPVGRRAALRMRALWAVVGRFERLIGRDALRVAVERAERG